MKWITPLAAFGPYRAEPGPSTTSARSMSELVVGLNHEMFTRSDGTRAIRKSVMFSAEPENTLLKPRTTVELLCRPVGTKSTPAFSFTWSIGVTAGRSAMSSRVTTSMAAGALRAFSTLLDVVTVIGFRLKLRSTIVTLRFVV